MMSQHQKAALLLLVGVASLAFIFGMTTAAKLAEADEPDPYAYYEVVGNDSYLVRYNPQTGSSWLLVCPTTAMRDCAWDPIEVRDE